MSSPVRAATERMREGTSIFPRLAGQHAAYVVRQLEVIQRKFRDSPIMHGVIKG